MAGGGKGARLVKYLGIPSGRIPIGIDVDLGPYLNAVQFSFICGSKVDVGSSGRDVVQRAA